MTLKELFEMAKSGKLEEQLNDAETALSGLLNRNLDTTEQSLEKILVVVRTLKELVPAIKAHKDKLVGLMNFLGIK
ncbi:MAG: hypothetical protein V1701_02775 [Planctomycetota bacterium]